MIKVYSLVKQRNHLDLSLFLIHFFCQRALAHAGQLHQEYIRDSKSIHLAQHIL